MTLSGWCIDSFHEKCDEYYIGRWEHTCSCKCHGK